MLASLPDGRAKLYVTWKLLQLRREREALFLHGGYTAVHSAGARARHLVAFARRHGGEAVVTVAAAARRRARHRARRAAVRRRRCGATRGSALPFLKDGTVLRDVLSGREHRVAGGGLRLADVLADFPAAVLVPLARPRGEDALELGLDPEPVVLELAMRVGDLAAAPQRFLQALAVGFLVGLARCEPRLGGLRLSRRAAASSRLDARPGASRTACAPAPRAGARAASRAALVLAAHEIGALLALGAPRAWYSRAHCL